jgi:colanic acid biosynthesis glycosyl transferase WcaI
MKILLLTQWYPPEPAKLLSDLAECIQQAGHEITVLTGFPNYPSGKLYPGYSIKLWQREQINGIPVIRVPLYPSHDQSSWQRVLNYLSFSQSSSLLGPWLAHKPDVIHVYHPPLTAAWPGWLLSRLWNVPFTFEIQDMWPETLQATRMMGNQKILRLVSMLAKQVYSRAAAIRVISPGFRENLIQKGVAADKIHVISNWADTEVFQPIEPDRQLAQSLGMDGRFNIMYAGNIGMAQGCEVIIHAADAVRDLTNVQFVFVGDGAALEDIRNLSRERNLTNVKFLGRFPPEAMSGLYALADVLILKLLDDPLFRITIPHKSLSYMACGKPILVAVAGDTADMVEQAGAGLICPPGDAQIMAQTVRRFYAMSAAERQQMGDNGRRAVLQQYEKKFLIGKIIDMIELAVKQKKKRRNQSPTPLAL